MVALRMHATCAAFTDDTYGGAGLAGQPHGVMPHKLLPFKSGWQGRTRQVGSVTDAPVYVVGLPSWWSTNQSMQNELHYMPCLSC